MKNKYTMKDIGSDNGGCFCCYTITPEYLELLRQIELGPRQMEFPFEKYPPKP